MGRTKLFKKILIVVGLLILFILVTIFLLIYFMPELSILYIKYEDSPKHSYPDLYMVPVTRVLKKTNKPLNEEIVSFNLVFRSPWGAPIKSEHTEEVEVSRFWFPGEREMIVMPNGTIAYDIYKDLKEGDQTYKQYVGNTLTVYGLLGPILNTTPDNIRFFQPRDKMEIELTRLKMRMLVVPRFSKVYYLKAPDVEAVEYYINESKVSLEISDENGNFILVIVGGPKIKQSEIEQLVASMHIEKP